MTNSNSTTTITGNTIHGNGNSSTNLSKGIATTSTGSTLIANNLIYGGNGNDAQGVNPASASVVTAKIYNNTIIAGTRTAQTYATAIVASGSSTPDIQNNILYVSTGTNKYCIGELATTADPSVIKNNNFYGCSTAFLYDEASTNKTDITTMEAVDSTNYKGNVNLDPTFVDLDGSDNDISTISDNNLKLQSGTGVNVRQGGLDLSSTFTTDFSGTTRTTTTGGSPTNTGAAGWSMGAYEQD